MDLSTATPDALDRPGSSPDPVPTRPNPFDDENNSARKRRRTSPVDSPTPSSPSPSSNPVAAPEQPTTNPDTVMVQPDDVDSPTTASTAMHIDPLPSLPTTPEGSRATSTAAQPPSSRVTTINLRHHGGMDGAASSPDASSTPASPSDGRDRLLTSDLNMQDVDSDQRRGSGQSGDDTPTSSTLDASSPEVIDIVELSHDGAARGATTTPDDEEVLIVGEQSSFDFARDFPFQTQNEPLPQVVHRIILYFESSAPGSPSSNDNSTSDENVLSPLNEWMGHCIGWFQRLGLDRAIACVQGHQTFWTKLADLIQTVAQKRHTYSLYGATRASANFFIEQAAALAAAFVAIDIKNLRRQKSDPNFADAPAPFVLSNQMLQVFAQAARQPKILQSGDHAEALTAEEVLSTVKALSDAPGGGLGSLLRLIQALITLVPRYPKLADRTAPATMAAAAVLHETMVLSRTGILSQNEARARMAVGYQLFEVVADAFSTSIDKHLTHLNPGRAEDLVLSLADILISTLSAAHQNAAERIKQHRHEYPSLPEQHTALAISYEWRLSVLCRLIKCSQMQLRVMAVRLANEELIRVWKTHNNDEQGGRLFMRHLAARLDSTQIVEYILDPACHPEITGQSGNIVAFFVVTSYYRDEHTDLLWRSFSEAQDLRICNALQTLISPVLHLFHREHFVYLFGKFQHLPIQDYSPAVRQLLDSALQYFLTKSQADNDFQADNEEYRFLLPKLLVRLLRESSVVTPDGQLVSPHVHTVAQTRFLDLVIRGLHPDVRRDVYTSCTADIAARTRTALGSMWVLATCLRQPRSADVPSLMQDYELPRSMVEELEHATTNAGKARVESVLNGPTNIPRMQLLVAVIEHEPAAIPSGLNIRLFDALIGSNAVSEADRDAGWHILNTAAINSKKGSAFLSTCFTEYLPRILPDHIRPGTLEFVKRILLKHVNPDKDFQPTQEVEHIEEPEVEDTALDNEKSFVGAGVEQLWRMLLSTTNETLAEAMTRTLNDIYIESRVIREYPHERARQIHLGVVDRCINQMQHAAELLKAEQDEIENDASDTTPVDSNSLDAERCTFTRSLAVLQAFLKAYRSSARFSAPDIRSLMLESPTTIQGDPAGLKYQSFSGMFQSDILPLAIGSQNTAASLLATLKQATGFDNYRVYYKGSPFTISEQDISRSLEELNIQTGLLLVKKEATGGGAPLKPKPGTSSLEIEILQHFQPLWSYLSMEPPLACQVYYFLTNLPADSRTLEVIDSPSSAHYDIFPKGEPYKCLYAAYALEQFLNTAHRSTVRRALAEGAADEDTEATSTEALARARSLIVDAISDTDILGESESVLPKHQLSEALIQLYLRALNDATVLGQITIPESGTPAVGRLIDLARSALAIPRHKHSAGLAQKVFAGMLRTSALNEDFWQSFKTHPDTIALIEDILINEKDPMIRWSAAEAIQSRTSADSPTLTVLPGAFRDFFWPALSNLIGKATELPGQCKEFFTIVQSLLKNLFDLKEANLLDLQKLVLDCCLILQEYETTEELGVPFVEDVVTDSLSALVHSTLLRYKPALTDWEFPPCFAERLFWQHLFPKDRVYKKDRVPRPVLGYSTRTRLYGILLLISEKDEASTTDLLRALGRLTRFDPRDDENPYEYDLPQGLDRLLEVRAACGYAGLRNLGNTCYLNSLLAQLYMNPNFRRFMIEAPVKDEDAQELLFETRKLFCNLQDSGRRYVETHMMVSAIKTYEDTAIDVGVQMDVDEFYNLLFDRWEGQLSTPAERQKFRAFYGGQLVQQVSSKECEHISERFEPFSAIQCDIKGKKNLFESLQAYVDGEVMQGDNKYKCSGCDRHVDAVKRACLKDVPDNLIFHLKRFDFNLRTMTRSKINDYFSFPSKIDMRPYTIEHLSDSSKEQEPDMFELVGVLVHAGTAESGHYYSYIRQRPNTGERDTWLEFNDDMVSPWDPDHMEDATFGTLEPRTYEHGGFAYERSNNAYMLFYQRSSTLAAQQAAIQANGLKAPVKVPIPLDIFETIMNDNLSWLRRWCLYDTNHFQFTYKLAERVLASATKQCPPGNHRLQDRAMDALLGLFDQAVTRSKDLGFVEPFRRTVQAAVENCSDCALTFMRYMFDTQEPLKALVQRNADFAVRAHTAELFISAVKRIRQEEPVAYGLTIQDPDNYDLDRTIAGNCIILFDFLWTQFHVNARSWNEVFGLVLTFARLGEFETALLLNEDWMWKMMMIVATDATFPDLNDHFRRLHAILSRRALNRPVNYTVPIILIEHFMKALSPTVSGSSIADADDRLEAFLSEPHKPLPWAHSETETIRVESNYHTGSVFLRRLLEVEQAIPSVTNIIRSFARGDKTMRGVLYRVLEYAMDERAEIISIRPYLRAILVFVEADPASRAGLDLVESAIAAARHPESDGKVYLSFVQEVNRKLSGAVPWDRILHWASIWAPGLLGYPTRSVADETEEYIKEGLLPIVEDQDDGMARTVAAQGARDLATKCLALLKRDFVGRPVARASIGNLQRVIHHCERFFAEDDGEGSNGISREHFARVRDDIYVALHATLVEELDDDGSDWDSSGQFESLADMNMQT